MFTVGDRFVKVVVLPVQLNAPGSVVLPIFPWYIGDVELLNNAVAVMFMSIIEFPSFDTLKGNGLSSVVSSLLPGLREANIIVAFPKDSCTFTKIEMFLVALAGPFEAPSCASTLQV